MISIQDFITDAFNQGCTHFEVTTHITPHGLIKIRFNGKHDNDIEADGLVHNDSVSLIENVKC